MEKKKIQHSGWWRIKTAQKGFREREWIKKEVSYKPVSQTGRVGTSPLSGGWGGGGVWRGTELRWLLGFLPLISVLMKFNLSKAGPRLSCVRTAWGERERERMRESDWRREEGGSEHGKRRGGGDDLQKSGGKTRNCVLYDTESSLLSSGMGVSVVFRTGFDSVA